MATRRYADTPDLKPETIAVLLRGWAAPAPEPSAPGFCGGFLELYDPEPGGPAALWREHETFLRHKAAQWGWSPEVVGPDGRLYFWAEAVAAGIERRR